MTLPRPDDAFALPSRDDADDLQTPPSRDLALAALAREANMLALSAGRQAMVPPRGAGVGALAVIALAAETERVARRIQRAIEGMRAADGPGGPTDEQLAAATAALSAARAIAAHSQSAAEGTRVAAEGFAAAAASLEASWSRDDQPLDGLPTTRAN